MAILVDRVRAIRFVSGHVAIRVALHTSIWIAVSLSCVEIACHFLHFGAQTFEHEHANSNFG